jgi:hypothetical protein
MRQGSYAAFFLAGVLRSFMTPFGWAFRLF